MKKRLSFTLGGIVLLAACTSMPTGPSVMVLPGTGKNFDAFRVDDLDCKSFANGQVGGNTPDQASESSGLKSAAVGTAIGAAAGAIIGGQRGAATGAGAGLIVGGATGAGAAGASQRTLQQRYDIGYQQCMYSKGHRVPTAGRFERNDLATRPALTPPPPPAAGTIPPPPSGSPPPPPSGVR